MVLHEQRWKSWAFPSPADALQNYTGGNLTVTGPRETASIFATYPAPYLSLNNGFLDQVSARGRPGKAPVFALVPWDSLGCGVGSISAPSPPQLPVLDKIR